MAPDFFSYFDNTAPLLWKDSTLYCISAWNDNGQEGHVSEPGTLCFSFIDDYHHSSFLIIIPHSSLSHSDRLYRSDFFPGLGWMMIKPVWEEYRTQWPPAYWDDWLRHPDRRHGRACIRPEVSRTYTFGEKGTSQAQ